MRRLVYSKAARAHLADIFDFIASESGDGDIAESFVEKLAERCERLASLPGILGAARPELRPDLRSLPYRGYVIFFRYGDGSVEVAAILSARRDLDGYAW